MGAIKDESYIKWNSSSKVDLKCLYLIHFNKNSTKKIYKAGPCKISLDPINMK